MTTVPSWIANAVAIKHSFGISGGSAYRVTGWRATKTRVMVTLEGHWSRNEIAFRLDDLREVGKSSYEALCLFPPDAPEVVEATRKQTIRRAVASVKAKMSNTRLDASSMTAERLCEALEDLMRTASMAIIDIARVEAAKLDAEG